MSDIIDISKLDKAEVLVALHNRAKQQRMGVLAPPHTLTREEAVELLKRRTYFDYLNGRVLKVDLESDMLDTRLYDRDNGRGATAEILAPLLATCHA